MLIVKAQNYLIWTRFLKTKDYVFLWRDDNRFGFLYDKKIASTEADRKLYDR